MRGRTALFLAAALIPGGCSAYWTGFLGHKATGGFSFAEYVTTGIPYLFEHPMLLVLHVGGYLSAAWFGWLTLLSRREPSSAAKGSILLLSQWLAFAALLGTLGFGLWFASLLDQLH